MNKKGYTLIELIVTIALLAIIAVVSFVSITVVIKESHNKECKNMETTIVNAAKSYISDYRYNNVWTCGETATFKAKVLLDKKYLTKELKNPYTSDTLDASSISITANLDNRCNPLSVTVENLPNNCQR